MVVTIIGIIILIFSAAVHEFSHGLAAWRLGDSTAKDAGRLTLNPIAHIDPIGSILMPIIGMFSGFMFAWAKPVPYNPYNLRDQKFGDLKVALAGPFSNLIIAVVAGLASRFVPISFEMKQALIFTDRSMVLNLTHGSFWAAAYLILTLVILYNLVLFVFNLVPIPPLDGSKIIYTLLPYDLKNKWAAYEDKFIIVLFILIMFGFFSFIQYPIMFLWSLFLGV
jgi:Zn-dependent protease